MLKKISYLLCFFVFNQCAFANFNDEVNDYKVHEKSLVAGQTSQVSSLANMSQENVKKSLAMINQLMGTAQDSAKKNLQQGGKAANGAMLFVSTSMPSQLIIAMAMQAAKYKIPVIMRGLVDNSMPKTLQEILNIKTQAKKTGVAV
ncbi:hypothetical protein AVM71_16360 (plasmid) [Piscirickettsia salmonis]|nr:hypothetical protein AVM71_16360 [Piscirickettsia salmonis]